MLADVKCKDYITVQGCPKVITNAIIHSDMKLNGILEVEKYDDRFVFMNSKLLKLTIKQIYERGKFKARNQCMQVLLQMIGYEEDLGSGFPHILSARNVKPD